PKIYEQSIYGVQVEGGDGVRGQRLRSYVVDITLQRRLDQEVKRLRQQSQLYRQLTSEGLLFVDAETKKIVEVNPAYCQLLGYSKAELLSQTLYQIVAADRETLDSQLMA
ncbi:MAG: PAS domain S-box protein, partial [Microcystaceae cyanobacterium]